MSRATRKNGPRRASGFTMMEAIIALVLMMVGILGMGALAGATVRSNTAANDRTAATYLAEKMLAQMRTEAMGWNRLAWSPTLDVSNVATEMPLLSKLPGGSTSGTTGFVELTQQFGATKAFTPQLQLVAPGAAGAKFCVHYRLTWLQPRESIRADVRVYWMRRGADPTVFSFYDDCGTNRDDVDAMAKNVASLRCVARSSLLQRNSAGGAL